MSSGGPDKLARCGEGSWLSPIFAQVALGLWSCARMSWRPAQPRSTRLSCAAATSTLAGPRFAAIVLIELAVSLHHGRYAAFSAD